MEAWLWKAFCWWSTLWLHGKGKDFHKSAWVKHCTPNRPSRCRRLGIICLDVGRRHIIHAGAGGHSPCPHAWPGPRRLRRSGPCCRTPQSLFPPFATTVYSPTLRRDRASMACSHSPDLSWFSSIISKNSPSPKARSCSWGWFLRNSFTARLASSTPEAVSQVMRWRSSSLQNLYSRYRLSISISSSRLSVTSIVLLWMIR